MANTYNYTNAYLSVSEALKSAGYEVGKNIEIDWINSDEYDSPDFIERLKQADGIFSSRGFGIVPQKEKY